MKTVQKNIPFYQQPEKSSWCGAACLKMIFKYFGIDSDMTSIWKAISQADSTTGRDNCRTNLMGRHARTVGLKACVVSSEYVIDVIDACLNADICMISLHRANLTSVYAHFTVVTGRSFKGIYEHSPEVASGNNNLKKEVDFVNLVRPVKNGEFSQPNTMLLITKDNADVINIKGTHNDCVREDYIFSAVAPLTTRVLCLDHDRWFDSPMQN